MSRQVPSQEHVSRQVPSQEHVSSMCFIYCGAAGAVYFRRQLCWHKAGHMTVLA